MSIPPTPRLGVDIGRVIIEGPADPDADTTFLDGTTDDAMGTPPVPGAFAALARLTERFEGRVWLVSKCGEHIEARSRQWLDHHRFFETTGIAPDHVRFCRRRPDKAIHAAELGLTHFVDDRPDVHEALAGIVAHRFLFATGTAPIGMRPVPTWAEAEAAIIETMPAIGGS